MKFILIFVFLILSCFSNVNLKHFNFSSGTELAQTQDKVIECILNSDSISSDILPSLENNQWIKTADSLAPSNLVIRQYCLIDILKDTAEHYDRIYELTKLLSYDGKIWAEGYSYWNYTYVCLELWIRHFEQRLGIAEVIKIVDLIQSIKEGFIKTAYVKNGFCYPAPFGDVRDEPLSVELQNLCMNRSDDSLTHSVIKKYIDGDNVYYTIEGKPLGLNTHIPKDSYHVEIRKGSSNYVFYTGYDNKYKNRKEELKDILDSSRIKSIKTLGM